MFETIRLTIRVAQRVIIRILYEHVGKLDLGPVHVLTSDHDGQFVIHQTGMVRYDIADLSRKVGREFW